MLTFEWIPSYSSRGTRKMAVSEVKFGDGYTQRTTETINNNSLVFQLTFNKTRSADYLAMDAFIASLGGTQPFIWNPPAPYNYADAKPWLAFGYDAGSFVAVGSNVFLCVKTHDVAKPVSNQQYWKFVARLPMLFICKGVDGSPDQYDSNNVTLTFEQVFDPQ